VSWRSQPGEPVNDMSLAGAARSGARYRSPPIDRACSPVKVDQQFRCIPAQENTFGCNCYCRSHRQRRALTERICFETGNEAI
jgi:hypothetical protein